MWLKSPETTAKSRVENLALIPLACDEGRR